jgi:hypothetical protein
LSKLNPRVSITPILGLFAKYQGTVGTPKSEVVFDGIVNLQVSSRIGAVIKVALGILIKDIDGWG